MAGKEAPPPGSQHKDAAGGVSPGTAGSATGSGSLASAGSAAGGVSPGTAGSAKGSGSPAPRGSIAATWPTAGNAPTPASNKASSRPPPPRPELAPPETKAKDEESKGKKAKDEESKGKKGKSEEGKGEEGKSEEGKGKKAKDEESKGKKGKSEEGKGEEGKGKGEEGKDKKGKSQGKGDSGTSFASMSLPPPPPPPMPPMSVTAPKGAGKGDVQGKDKGKKGKSEDKGKQGKTEGKDKKGKSEGKGKKGKFEEVPGGVSPGPPMPETIGGGHATAKGTGKAVLHTMPRFEIGCTHGRDHEWVCIAETTTTTGGVWVFENKQTGERQEWRHTSGGHYQRVNRNRTRGGKRKAERDTRHHEGREPRRDRGGGSGACGV